MTVRRLALVAVSVLLLSASGCGGEPAAKAAVTKALQKSNFGSVKNVVDDSGRLRVKGEGGSEILLDVVKEGGKFVIDACQQLDANGSSCSDVPIGQQLDP
jgi:hypothetical protein